MARKRYGKAFKKPDHPKVKIEEERKFPSR